MEDTPLDRFYDWLRQQESPSKYLVDLVRRLVAEDLLSGYLVATTMLDERVHAAVRASNRKGAIKMVMKLLPQVVKNDAMRQLIEMLMSDSTAVLDCSKCNERERCPFLKHHQPTTIKPEEMN